MASMGPFHPSEEAADAEDAGRSHFWTVKQTLALIGLVVLGWAMLLSPVILEG